MCVCVCACCVVRHILVFTSAVVEEGGAGACEGQVGARREWLADRTPRHVSPDVAQLVRDAFNIEVGLVLVRNLRQLAGAQLDEVSPLR